MSDLKLNKQELLALMEDHYEKAGNTVHGCYYLWAGCDRRSEEYIPPLPNELIHNFAKAIIEKFLKEAFYIETEEEIELKKEMDFLTMAKDNASARLWEI